MKHVCTVPGVSLCPAASERVSNSAAGRAAWRRDAPCVARRAHRLAHGNHFSSPPSPSTRHVLRIGLTFFQNSLLRGSEEGPPFCLAPSFAVSVGVGFLAAPWVSGGTKVALSALRSADVAGDFSAPYRVKKKYTDFQAASGRDLAFINMGWGHACYFSSCSAVFSTHAAMKGDCC